MRVEKFETDFFEKKIILKHLHPPIEKEIERHRSEINSPETFDHEWQCPKTKKLSNSLRRSEERNEEKQKKKKRQKEQTEERKGGRSTTHDATQVRPPIQLPTAVLLRQTGSTAAGIRENLKMQNKKDDRQIMIRKR